MFHLEEDSDAAASWIARSTTPLDRQPREAVYDFLVSGRNG